MFLVISFMLELFSFIPIICLIPFNCKATNRNNLSFEKNSSEELSIIKYKDLAILYYHSFSGKITTTIIRFCYHSRERLNIN